MFTGNSGVLDPPGAVSKLLFRDQFLVPTGNDINRIDTLLSMTGTAWTPSQLGPLARALVAFNGQTKPLTLSDLAAIISDDATAPFIRASEIGLTGDGVTDDSFPLQQEMDLRSPMGGAVYFLRAATPGSSFYFAHSPRVPSNITLLWASPILLAKEATLFVGGTLRRSGNNIFRLSINAAEGATVLGIDTSFNGGGAVSNFLAVGNQLQISGRRDGCATPTRMQELRVTAVDDVLAQITVHQPLRVAYPVTWPPAGFQANYGTSDLTEITKLSSVAADADLAAGENLVIIQGSNVGIASPGDMVVLKDDATVADISGVVGGDVAPCNEELAMVVPSQAGDPAASVRLDRRTSRAFTEARNFRLLRTSPVTNVVISGARFLSAEAPDLSPAPVIHWTEQRYCRGVTFDNCVVPNTDIFGKRGWAYRAYRCLEPVYLNCISANAKFVDAGEGNGIVLDRSTGGRVSGGLHDAMRHGTQAVSGNGHVFHDVTLINPRHVPVDCHGTLEVDCHWYNCTLIAGTQYEANEGRAPVAVVFGNPTFLAGPVRCGFHGGSISGFKNDSGALEAVINLFPGARNCIIDTSCSDIGMLFEYRDLPGLGGVVSSGHRIRAQVDGCENRRLVDIQSRFNGASSDTLLDTRIEVYGRNLNGCFYIVNATELEICNCDIDETIFDPSANYFVEAAGCTNLRIFDNRLANGARFVRMSGCTGYRVVGNRSTDQAETTMFFDAGGNSGIWLDNREVGFLGFYTPNATSSLTVDGRLPGHYDLPDDSVLVLLPVQAKGTGHFYSTSGEAFLARFVYDTVTSFIDLDAVTTVNVDGGVTALTGTTGTDGNITIAVVNADNSIQIENRTGATIRISGRVD